jgi:hypothetical protein
MLRYVVSFKLVVVLKYSLKSLEPYYHPPNSSSRKNSSKICSKSYLIHIFSYCNNKTFPSTHNFLLVYVFNITQIFLVYFVLVNLEKRRGEINPNPTNWYEHEGNY